MSRDKQVHLLSVMVRGEAESGNSENVAPLGYEARPSRAIVKMFPGTQRGVMSLW